MTAFLPIPDVAQTSSLPRNNQGSLAAKERKERKEQTACISMRSLRSFAAKRIDVRANPPMQTGSLRYFPNLLQFQPSVSVIFRYV
jgi:hypothetical protein